MKKYEYEHVKISNKIIGSKVDGHKEIIDNYAKKGYRYVGYIPTKIDGYGRFKELDLIFETDY